MNKGNITRPLLHEKPSALKKKWLRGFVLFAPLNNLFSNNKDKNIGNSIRLSIIFTLFINLSGRNKFLCQIPHENKNLSAHGIDRHYSIKNALNDFNSLPDTYQNLHSFSVLSRSSPATSELENKNRTHAFSKK